MVNLVNIVFCTQLTYSEIARARIGRGKSVNIIATLAQRLVLV